MEQFKVNIPKGMEIDISKLDPLTGNGFFKKKEIKLPTTNKECVDFLPDMCYYINDNGEIDETNDYRFEINTITTKEYAEAFLALMQLVKYRDIWNEGWIADWTYMDYKYVIFFNRGKKTHDTFSSAAEVLNFKTAEIRDKFSEQFNDLIETAKPLL